MIEHFEQATKLINSSGNILLTMHERMDGDDGGSILALYHQLVKMGKKVTVVIKKGVPPSLAFLPGSQKIQEDITTNNFDLLIACGCSNLERTGLTTITELKKFSPDLKILNIDHHPDNKLFGDINLVDKNKSSVAELVYDFFIYNNWGITKDIATCLLCGIITDTGCFKHSNTQASTLKASAELVRKGGQINLIITNAYKSKDAPGLKAWGKALENTHYDKKEKIIYSVMTDKDLTGFQNLSQTAFDGLAETLNKVPEAKCAIFLRQDGPVIKASLRSDEFKNTDVSALAKTFGGGGHRLAAGFSVVGKLVKDESGKWKVT